MVQFTRWLSAFTRKKKIDLSAESELAKCLSTLDLTALGIGSTLGVGVYVLAGSVAKETAGPAVVLSFAIAAIASIFAGLCYAEFGARVPKAGSAYVYSYVTVGEFIAFLIGWTLILEYVIGSASVVRGLSIYIDALTDYSMEAYFKSLVHIDIDYFSSYPDFFALGLTIAFSVALAFGAKQSSSANNFFTLVNLGVVLFVIGAGSLRVNGGNWNINTNCTKMNVEDCEHGVGGFAPFGIAGILKGAATCFYGFIGFDCVATAGEEAKNPKKSIPIAIVASLTVAFLAYFGVSVILTTVLPYYEQNPKAPFPHMFDTIGWNWAKWIVTLGAICGLCASLLGAMFPLPRILYAIASDGLIFKWMGEVNSRFQTPFMGTLFAGFFTGILAMIFDLDQLVNMMSIGTLLAYSIVAGCVLILRYEMDEIQEIDEDPRSFITIAKQLINSRNLLSSTRLTDQIVTWLVFLYVVLCIPATLFIKSRSEEILNGSIWTISLISSIILCLIVILTCIYCQPVSGKKLSFSVPLVPFLPAFSIFVNIGLMIMLDIMTWVRFCIWMIIGLLIYFGYGMWNSKGHENINTEIKRDTFN